MLNGFYAYARDPFNVLDVFALLMMVVMETCRFTVVGEEIVMAECA